MSIFSFETKPWLPTPWEFSLNPWYSYQWYPDIADTTRSYSSNDQFIGLNLGLPVWPQWDAALEIVFSETSMLSWGTQSLAANVRYQFLDDIQGDPVSLTTDFSARWVPKRNLRDPSTPYARNWNFELGTSVGKEFSSGPYWFFRAYGWAAIGQSTQGPPWLRFLADISGNILNDWRLSAFADTYLGFGSQQTVNPDAFDGYAHIAHRSVDVGGKLAYHFRVWGTLSLDYIYRVYARAYPEHNQGFTVRYSFPFSVL